MKIEQLHRNLVSAKDEISYLKIQIAIATHDYENRGNSDWSQVPLNNRNPKPKMPKLLLRGTSNLSKLDPSKLSSKFETVKQTAYHTKQKISSTA